MDYGTYKIDLWRVRDTHTMSYLSGLVGSRTHVKMQLFDWICNNFCDGRNPFESPKDEVSATKDALIAKYCAANKRFKISRVRVSIVTDISAHLTAIVL